MVKDIIGETLTFQDHIEAIEYLTKQGIKVIRIGHNKMTKAPEISGLIDLVNFARPPEVDIFLSASCLFYYGNPSGPCSLAYQFGRPMLYVSVFPYTHVRANSLNQIYHFVKSVHLRSYLSELFGARYLKYFFTYSI